MRSGRYIKQPTGYRAFIPVPLPPEPAIGFDEETMRLLSVADLALGRLDGVASSLPNPDLFVAMYVRQEAVLSSQIEGTQSTLQDILEFEMEGDTNGLPKDVEEVVNYVKAMNYGLARLENLPLSLRLIREIHEQLLTGVRGAERQPGEFRTSQNWIGPQGCTLNQAEFVPPPPHEMQNALSDLERFLHDRESLPVLIQCALAHAQFETIHPFLDGNGRVGRLLITLLLCERGVLRKPLLYLSYYLKAYRAQYYDRLMAIRNQGDWEGWVKFFLRGVVEVSNGASDTSRAILQLRETHLATAAKLSVGAAIAIPAMEFLFQHPVLSIRMIESHVGCSFATAGNLVRELVDLGILSEVTGKRRNRQFRYDAYVKLFDRQLLDATRAQGGRNSMSE